jgi:hypothetical protein
MVTSEGSPALLHRTGALETDRFGPGRANQQWRHPKMINLKRQQLTLLRPELGLPLYLDGKFAIRQGVRYTIPGYEVNCQ